MYRHCYDYFLGTDINVSDKNQLVNWSELKYYNMTVEGNNIIISHSLLLLL